jgi:hypothetical protein
MWARGQFETVLGRLDLRLRLYSLVAMALLLTIVLVALLVGVRFMLPPIPGLFQAYYGRWGSHTIIKLCGLSIAGAALAIFISRR